MTKDPISQMEDIVASLKPILTNGKKQQDFKTVEESLDKIKQRETNILVCGEFKRGKSSFINAFLEQNLCPVDTNIATAAVSIIKYGEKIRITRQFGDFSNLQSEELSSLEQITQYAKGKAEDIDNTVLLEIEVPNQKLKSGIVLIDTPGVGGLDPRHAFLTNYFLPKADITLFVTDKDSPMTSTEIEFFEKKIAPYSRQCAVLINKADLFKSEDDQKKWVSDVQNKCKNAKNVTKVIPISANLKLEFVKSKDTEDLKDSNFESIEKEINSFSENFKKGLLLDLKNNILSLLDEIQKPIVTQIAQIRIPDPKLIEKLETELLEYKLQNANFENPNSEFRIKLNKKLKKARTDAENKLEKESILFSSDTLTQLIKSQKNRQLLLSEVNSGIGSIATELDMIIDATFEQITLEMALEYDLSEQKRFDFTIDSDITPDKVSFGSKLSKRLKIGMAGVGLGSLAVWAFGPIGICIGIWQVWKSISDANYDEETAAIKARLSPYIAIARNELRNYISDRFDDFYNMFILSIQQNTQRLIKNSQEIVNSITRLKAETVQQQQLKSKILSEELKPVENLMAVTKLFLSNPFER